MLSMTIMYSLVFTNQCLFFRSVSAPCDGCTVLLAHPAQVTHGLHHDHMRKKLSPEGRKSGVAHRTH